MTCLPSVPLHTTKWLQEIYCIFLREMWPGKGLPCSWNSVVIKTAWWESEQCNHLNKGISISIKAIYFSLKYFTCKQGIGSWFIRRHTYIDSVAWRARYTGTWSGINAFRWCSCRLKKQKVTFQSNLKPLTLVIWGLSEEICIHLEINWI